MRISDEERREVAKRLREISYKPGWSLGDWWLRVHGAVVGSEHCLCPQEDVAVIADLIDRPMCHDLVEHKQDPFIPGKRMVDGYFHCSDCGWDGQIWEHIGFGDMLAYEAVHCPKCGAIIERRA